jgi:hypothetical protein
MRRNSVGAVFPGLKTHTDVESTPPHERWVFGTPARIITVASPSRQTNHVNIPMFRSRSTARCASDQFQPFYCVNCKRIDSLRGKPIHKLQRGQKSKTKISPLTLPCG